MIADDEMEIVDAAAAERELAARRADAHWRATRMAALDADPAIERELGKRPDSPIDREQWEQAAAAQQSYRLQYGALPHEHEIDDLTGRQAADWHHAIQAISAGRCMHTGLWVVHGLVIVGAVAPLGDWYDRCGSLGATRLVVGRKDMVAAARDPTMLFGVFALSMSDVCRVFALSNALY